MLLFIEQGVRGGISMISQRYARENVSGEEGYNSSEPSQYIMHCDANNLYG